MKVQHMIGADISKKTIDFVEHLSGAHRQIDNSSAGFSDLLKWFKHQKIEASKVLIVMEHTGLYSYRLEDFLHAKGIAFTKVNALAIKRSGGIVRGKNDKIDARRIAAYGYEKRETLSADKTSSHQLKRLQMLQSTRKRLVKQRAGLLCALEEYLHIGIAKTDLIVRSQQKIVRELDTQIGKLEEDIKRVLKQDSDIQRTYKLVTSVKGIGQEIAVATIIKTGNFTRFTDARKFACFAGTAPFEHTSGTSVKGKTKVSHIADKQMKTLLELGARTAVQHDKELKQYYERRLAMGKSPTSTLNIVRNKLIYRMFAVVKRGTPFVADYLQAS